VVVAKRTMPKLFRLVHFYTHNAIMSTRPLSPSMNTQQSASNDNKDVRTIETVSDVLMNITHTVFQMVPDSKYFAVWYSIFMQSYFVSLTVFMTNNHRTTCQAVG